MFQHFVLRCGVNRK